MAALEEEILRHELNDGGRVVDAEVETVRPANKRRRKLLAISGILLIVVMAGGGALMMMQKSTVTKSSPEVAAIIAKATGAVQTAVPTSTQPQPQPTQASQQSEPVTSIHPSPEPQVPAQSGQAGTPPLAGASTVTQRLGSMEKEVASLQETVTTLQKAIEAQQKAVEAKSAQAAKKPAEAKPKGDSPQEISATMTELGVVALLNDGIVVTTPNGGEFEIPVGKTSRRLGRIVKVDPQARLIVTDQKTYRLR